MTDSDKNASDLYREQSSSTSGGCESHIAIRHLVAALKQTHQQTSCSSLSINRHQLIV